ncbi:MAG: lyase family protein, partial [Anaerolineae bacterium]
MSASKSHLGQGDRFAEGPAPELVAAPFTLEAGDGPLLHPGLNLADLAHAVMLIEAGLIPPAPGAQLLAELLALHAIPAADFPFDPAHGDAYTNREQYLRRRIPRAAGWLKAGRPRREATTIAYLLAVRARLLALSGALTRLLRAILTLAEAHPATLMPDYTYLQPAQPTTLAHYLLTFAHPVARDLDRLRSAFARANRSPAGSGSVNGSRLPLNRDRLAELLGFDGLALHTRDAMWQPDLPIEVMAVAVAALVNADRLAEDLQIWASAEFGMVELADRHSRISLIMPQKKNPYSLAFVRGAAREMIGQLAGMAALGATPSGQVDNRIFAYGGVPRALERAAAAANLLAATLSGLSVKREVMARRAAQGLSGATDLADVIMLEANLDAGTAHRIVGRAARAALELGQPLDAPLLDAAAAEITGAPLTLPEATVAGAMDPAAIVGSRRGPGGAAPEPVTALSDEEYTHRRP